MLHILLTHSSVDGCLGYLCLLAMKNSAAMNILVKFLFGCMAFISLWWNCQLM